MAQVFFFDIFSENDSHLNAVELYMDLYKPAHGYECFPQFAVQLLSTDLDVRQSYYK